MSCEFFVGLGFFGGGGGLFLDLVVSYPYLREWMMNDGVSCLVMS